MALKSTVSHTEAVWEQVDTQGWLAPLELREVITEIAEDLHDCIEWALSPFGSDPEQHNRLWRKYPGY